MVRSRTYIATPPGATIKEQLIDRGMNQKEFAIRMNMSEKHISKLINGDVQLTSDVAFRLEMVLGVPAKFWSNLEAIYREKIIKANAENEMDSDIEFVKKLPYREMVKNGWIAETKIASERVLLLRKYFEVVNLGLIEHSQLNKIACRRLAETEKSDYALLSWAQKAKIEARYVDTASVDLKALSNYVSEVRKMTTMIPEDFCPVLTDLLASCGVALIFLPHIGGSFLHGATFYEGDKIVMGMTVRGNDADKFWFSFFHELGHVLLGHVAQTDGTSIEDEMSADKFARETLISTASFDSFVSHHNFTKESILSFAKSIGIDPGIVVGRLQKEGHILYSWHNDLKTKYLISA